MKEYDLDRIKDYVSMEDICDLLGIEKRRIGGLTSVLCPFHDDENFGNAFIKNNKITCINILWTFLKAIKNLFLG